MIANLASHLVKEYQGDRGDEEEFHGRGVLFFNSGNKYEGQFEHGYMHGKGTYNWKNGCQYVGEFKDNRIEGNGEYFW